jgi:menaquinone-dependent protoporphyrinogen IX oxidase
MKILVTHAGTSGLAASVAERVARVLTGLGAEVTLRPMSGVSGVKVFSAVIAGCQEQGGGWVPEAMEFVRRNQSVLGKKPFAIFTVIPSLSTDRGAESRMVIMQYTSHVRGMVHTVSEGFFSGEADSREAAQPGERSKFKLRLLLGLLREAENRGHSEIETWSVQLHEKLVKLLAK